MSEHWLQHAHGRIAAGDSEPEVLADYGWVQITDEEREAVLYFSGHYAGFYGLAMHGFAMRLGLYDLPRDTPDTHATPGEGSVQDRCTLTDEEREAVGVALQCVESARCQKHPEELAATETLIRADATLRKLMERLK